MTFWTPNDRERYEAMDPSTVVAWAPDGVPTTAGDLSRHPSRAPLSWDNELVLHVGSKFEPPKQDTCDEWAQTVYTAWQLITQGGRRLVDTESVERPRAGRKRDARDGITDASTVRVVNVHATHRPPRAAAEEDAQPPTVGRSRSTPAGGRYARTAATTACAPRRTPAEGVRMRSGSFPRTSGALRASRCASRTLFTCGTSSRNRPARETFPRLVNRTDRKRHVRRMGCGHP